MFSVNNEAPTSDPTIPAKRILERDDVDTPTGTHHQPVAKDTGITGDVNKLNLKIELVPADYNNIHGAKRHRAERTETIVTSLADDPGSRPERHPRMDIDDSEDQVTQTQSVTASYASEYTVKDRMQKTLDIMDPSYESYLFDDTVWLSGSKKDTLQVSKESLKEVEAEADQNVDEGREDDDDDSSTPIPTRPGSTIPTEEPERPAVLVDAPDPTQHTHLRRHIFPMTPAAKYITASFKSTSVSGSSEWLYDNKNKNWRNWPGLGPGKIFEKDITPKLLEVINMVIQRLNLQEDRVAVEFERKTIPTHDDGVLLPDILLLGTGPQAPPLPETCRTIKSLRDKTPKSDPQWKWCIAPIELKKEEALEAQGKKLPAYYQLGTYVFEVFAAQSNRRFVPSFVMTEKFAHFLLWDRAGVISTKRLNYQAHPLHFVNMLTLLVAGSPVRLGFDPYMHFPKAGADYPGSLLITVVGKSFEVERTLFHSYTLVGRGSACFIARRIEGDNDDDDKSPFHGDDGHLTHAQASRAGMIDDVYHRSTHVVIHDAWVYEESLLQYTQIIQHLETLRQRGIVKNVFPLESFEVILIDNTTDSISKNRNVKLSRQDNMVHVRTVYRCHEDCKALEQCFPREEFSKAMCDLMVDLTYMYEHAKTIHSDIMPWNILVHKDARSGSTMACLIDFTCAMDITKVPTRRPQPTANSQLFLSSNIWPKPLKFLHLNDLQSCYFIICFFLEGFHQGNITEHRLTGDLLLWGVQDARASRRAKAGHFLLNFDLEPSPRALATHPAPTQRLMMVAEKLHDYFRRRYLDAIDLVRASKAESGDEHIIDFRDITQCLH